MADFISMVTIADAPTQLLLKYIRMYLYILCRKSLKWQSVYLNGIMQDTVRQI